MITPLHDMAGQAVLIPLRRGEDTTPYPIQSRILLKTLLRHPLRVTGRVVWLIGELLLAVLDYMVHVTFRRTDSLQMARALWLQQSCRRVSRVFKVDLRTTGAVPTRGMLASNHLSYLDILVLGAVTPVAFVAKREVRNWPVFGWFVSL